MKFDNDIFISYAHLDNQPLVRDAEGWVSQFHRAVEVRVDQLLGKKSSVWRDPKLQGNDFFDDTIVEQLPNVAVLVSVFTPRYVHSTSCNKELTSFCIASQRAGGIRVQDKTRIFKVLKTPVPIEEHPEPIRDCLGYEFFKIDPVTGRVRELNHLFGGDAEREFWIKLDDLAQDICQLLKLLDNGLPGEEAADDISDEQAVFMADCSFDVREQYDSIKRDLLGHHNRVLPSRPYPLNVNELVPAIRELLSQCRMSVHIIGSNYGIIPEGTDRSIVELQNELAIEREEKGGFSRLVWIPPGLQVDDERQRRFIDFLRSDPRSQERGDLLETPLEDLNTQIHHALARTHETGRGTEVSAGDAPARRVYLVCDAADSGSAAAVADCLFDQGCDVVLPAFDGDEQQVRYRSRRESSQRRRRVDLLRLRERALAAQ